MKGVVFLGSQRYLGSDGRSRDIAVFRRENGDFQASTILIGATEWKSARLAAVEDAVAMIEARIAHEAKGSTR